MNVEIGTEAAQFPEREYLNGIFAAVHSLESRDQSLGAQISPRSTNRRIGTP
jgi:hypothetical protein